MINVPGIGSGLDIASLISQLVAAEGNPKTVVLAQKRSSIEAEISAFGQLRNALAKLQSATAKLKDPVTFNSNKASSSSPEFFTVSSSGNTAAGSYAIEVVEAAQSHKLLSPAYASAETDVGTGLLTIYSGVDSFTVTIDNDNKTLSGIRDAINDATDNTGVSASIINVDDGGGGTVSKLVLTADASGTDYALTVVVDDDDETDTDNTGLSTLYYDTGDATSPEQMTQVNNAVDASIRVDGELVVSSSNTIADAIQGITINVLKQDPGNTHTLSVTLDTTAVKNAINSFISSYNVLTNSLNTMTLFNSNTGQKGVLLGDQTILALTGQIRRELNKTVSGLTGAVDSLVDLGFKTEKDGTLSVDNSKLEAVLGSDLNSVSKLFSADDGIAAGIDTLLNEYVKSDGVLEARTDGLNSTIKRIDQDLVNLNERLTRLKDRLTAQFTALDGLLSRLQQTGNYLNSQLASLPKISISKS